MKDARINKGLTHSQLSEQTNIGVVRLTHLELGLACPFDVEKTIIRGILGPCDFVDEDTAKKNREKEDKYYRAFTKAHKMIKESGKEAGSITCPLCGNNLLYAVSPYNGHTRGKCDTDNCLSWIE